MGGKSTLSVHGKKRIIESEGSIATPIYQSVSFGFIKAKLMIKAAKGGNRAYIYGGQGNPTVQRLESKLAELEGAEDCAFFSSGMASISTTLLAFLRKGDHAVAMRNIFGETYEVLRHFLPMYGIETTFVDVEGASELAEAVRPTTKVVYIESPTNPTIKLVDIEQAAKVAHETGARLVVDNTFASPLNQRPLKLGADVSLHSATKYLNGHTDVVAGAAAGSNKLVGHIRKNRRLLGGTLDAHAAYMILRGLKTLALRVDRQNENGLRLAEFLEAHPRVAEVHYPGLKTHPQFDLASKQMTGAGGMLSFRIRGTAQDAMRFTESLQIATLASSLGTVETLVMQPAYVSHAGLSREERRRAGIPDSLVRVSVGVEDIADLIADFEQALLRI